MISGNTKNQDQPLLTLQDVESLFSSSSSSNDDDEEEDPESLMHLPASRAAAIAAERRSRLKQGIGSSSADVLRE